MSVKQPALLRYYYISNMSVKQPALLRHYYTPNMSVKQPALLRYYYISNMSVKQPALLRYYYTSNMSETASLSKVLPTPQTCQRTGWPGYPRFKLVRAVGALQPVDAQVRQLVVPQLGSAGGHEVAVFARELDVLMLTLNVAAKVLSGDGPERAVRTAKWSIT